MTAGFQVVFPETKQLLLLVYITHTNYENNLTYPPHIISSFGKDSM